MAGLMPGDSSHHSMVESGSYGYSHDKHEEVDRIGSTWYLSRKDIEENSPSRKDGIDLKKEAYLRKSYCTFLQDLGMRLKVPQVTIATAIIFCHRFFLRQSHAKNDRRTIATVCMFLAGKVEETPRPLKDVILVSYEIIHKKDPTASQKIKQKDVYEQQKELILLGERVVLATLGFDLNVHHPYKPLVEAIKKFKVAQNALAQVAWNFVNDGLRTSLCLQFKPHHIAAGAIFLAAKFLKVKLPSDGEKVWWQEFDVTPRQLEEVSNQMLELYEQNRAVPASNGNEAEGSGGAGSSHRLTAKEESTTINGYTQGSGHTSAKYGPSTPPPPTSRPVAEQPHLGKQNGPHRVTQSQNPDNWDHRTDGVNKDRQYHEMEASHRPHVIPDQVQDDPCNIDMGETTEEKEWKDDGHSFKSGPTANIRSSTHMDAPKGYSPVDAIKKIDKDKVKAALEKRRQSRGEVPRKVDTQDFDDIIERELESGVELAAENEKIKQERRQSWSSSKPQKSYESGLDNNAEEGELSSFGTPGEQQHLHSPGTGGRKRRAVSLEYSKHEQRHEFGHPSYPPAKRRDTTEDPGVVGRLESVEREHKRQWMENHV
ncbi:Cyclin-T1-3 [Acorus calamus]|uniref:Cyclin-T1-3 n=1 Tax=Acorus calamus TaxID=4465 RepID=A0AAV9FM97_ACOCL|nr:Cyclin-T1-3 [Acorus calamus]